MPFTEEIRTALETHILEHPKDKHGSHQYDLEEYGLTAERVRERFAGYIERFGLPAD